MNSNSLLTELRGLTKHYPFRYDFLMDHARAINADKLFQLGMCRGSEAKSAPRSRFESIMELLLAGPRKDPYRQTHPDICKSASVKT